MRQQPRWRSVRTDIIMVGRLKQDVEQRTVLVLYLCLYKYKSTALIRGVHGNRETHFRLSRVHQHILKYMVV